MEAMAPAAAAAATVARTPCCCFGRGGGGGGGGGGGMVALLPLPPSPLIRRMRRMKCYSEERAASTVASTNAATGDGKILLFDEQAEDLENYIADAGANKLVVLDISTKSCGPCKVVYPKLVKMSLEYPDALFIKINGDHSKATRALMQKWKVRAVPTFKFFRNGEMIHTHSGAKEDELRAFFLQHYHYTP